MSQVQPAMPMDTSDAAPMLAAFTVTRSTSSGPLGTRSIEVRAPDAFSAVVAVARSYGDNRRGRIVRKGRSERPRRYTLRRRFGLAVRYSVRAA